MTDGFVLPPVHGTKDDWHVLIVLDAEKKEVHWLHPGSCPISVSSRGGVSYDCHTVHDLMNAGFDGLFSRSDDHLEEGIFLVHPWVEEIRGFDWTEYDGGWEVIRLEPKDS